MARSYQRDGNGKFASAGRQGDVAKTVQQASREKKAERRKAKDALSGGKLGTKRAKRVSRAASVGRRASTKAARNSVARARARFS